MAFLGRSESPISGDHVVSEIKEEAKGQSKSSDGDALQTSESANQASLGEPNSTRIEFHSNEMIEIPMPLDFHEGNGGKSIAFDHSVSGKEVIEPSFHNSGKEVIEPSFHDSGKEVIEYFGKGGGEGGQTQEAGNGGLAQDEILGSMGEEGKRRALPYIPVAIGTGTGSGAFGSDAFGANAATEISGSNGSQERRQSGIRSDFDGSEMATPQPTGSGSSGAISGDAQSGSSSPGTSVPEGQRRFRSIPPALTSDIVVSGNGGAGVASGSSAVQTGSAGTPVSIAPTPQIQPLPPASIPVASTGGGVGGITPVPGGNPNPFSGASGSNGGDFPPAPQGNRPVITPIPPVAVPPQIAIGGATGSAPSTGGSLVPIPAISASGISGGSPATPASSIPPSGNLSTPSPSSNSGLSGESASTGVGRGNRGTLPSLLPVVPVAGAGAAGGGVPGVFPPPLPNRGNENSEPADEENHDDLPEQCIPWVVQEGQTIQSLAAASGTSPDVIMRINETSTIFPGQTIRLPVRLVVPCCD
ncbi:MAG: LysM peptidoglycan-binding domain-containing protein [Verrucomicrobiales bacterium]|nr:LysM peptidoglycan-binding domain-containing protein [Verrucomicrobiales bacterium]